MSDAKQHGREGGGGVRAVVVVAGRGKGGRDLKDVIYLGLIAC